MTRLASRLLPDGRRLHLSDGPIDLVIQAFAPVAEIDAAFAAAIARAATILDELCAELDLLRTPSAGTISARGDIARRMQLAVLAHPGFITPMAAVAGAVAEAVLRAMTQAATLDRAYVNNGGDIAVHLADGQSLSVGLIDRPDRPSLFGSAILRADDGICGVASSGWRGRSHSLGIADVVTVLAATAPDADAAATMIANAVDLPDHSAVTRVAASDLDPQSDLGARLVTRGVSPLSPAEIGDALDAGCAVARRLLRDGTIRAAALHLQGVSRVQGGALLGLDRKAA